MGPGRTLETVHTAEAADEALVAGALVGPEGIDRATALFRDRCRDPEALLRSHQSKIEEIVDGRADQHTVSFDGEAVDVSAVLAPDGNRYALLTLPRPEQHINGDPASPLFYEAIAASPAIVWVKDLQGRYLHVNGSYEQHLGAAAERVCGKTEDELAAGESIEGLRGRRNGGGQAEPLELEYVIAGTDGRPGLSVLRFALRSADGQPTALCGVAAPLPRADMAHSECARVLRLERWSRVDEAEAAAELLRAWRITPANGTGLALVAQPAEEGDSTDSSGEQFAALAAELDAALETSVRLGRELAEERRQVVALREASVMAARRAHDLLNEVRNERERSGELEEALTRAEAGLKELETEREREQRKAETTEAAAREAVAAEQHKTELLALELGAARDEIERFQSELSTSAAALAKEQRAVQTLRAELRTAEEAAERARRSAADVAAQAPARDEVEQERRRADQANAALAQERARAEQAQAEKQSAVAQVHAELRRIRAEAAESAAALRAEKQSAEAARAELTEVRAELERTQAAYAAKPSPQELEGHRTRAEQAEAASQRAHRQATESSGALKLAQKEADSLREELGSLRQELARVQRAAAQEHGEALAQTLEELERTRTEAVTSSTALAAQQTAAEALAAELSAVREQLARVQQAAPTPPADSVPIAELEHERARAEEAERQRQEVEASAAALRAELETRSAELEARSAELDLLRREAPAEPPATEQSETQPTGSADSPTWSPASQRALAAGVMEASDWQGVLKKAVTALGTHGGWDAAVGWQQDRGGFMKCAAIWVRGGAGLEAFETRTWKHRLGATTLAAAGAADGSATSCVLDLETAEDVALRAAAGAGMRYAVLVPIGDGTGTVGLLELVSASAGSPSAELALSLEAIGLQLGAIAHQLTAGSSPRWHVGKL